MKKILALALILCTFLVLFAGCSSGDADLKSYAKEFNKEQKADKKDLKASVKGTVLTIKGKAVESVDEKQAEATAEAFSISQYHAAKAKAPNCTAVLVIIQDSKGKELARHEYKGETGE